MCCGEMSIGSAFREAQAFGWACWIAVIDWVSLADILGWVQLWLPRGEGAEDYGGGYPGDSSVQMIQNCLVSGPMFVSLWVFWIS
jgi:hypothetical protein